MKYDVAVIGCGFVGLTLAAALNRAGVNVLGVEPRAEIREKIAAGVAPFHEPGLAEAMYGLDTRAALTPDDEAETYIVCVGTTPGSHTMLEVAAQQVAKHMRDGAMVIVRSTVRIGTTRTLIKPILDASDKRFDLFFCPERTVEGAALAELAELPQIIGTPDLKGSPGYTRCVQLFSALGERVRVVACTYEEAEAAKLLANSWRAVTFAYANEVARICERHGISASAAIWTANHHYGRSSIPLPGPVGGPCLPKDIALLIDDDPSPVSVIRMARSINEWVPYQIVHAVTSRARNPHFTHIAVLGTAFKGDPATCDTRCAPSSHVVEALTLRGYHVTTVDPVAPADQTSLGDEAFDAIVVMTNAPFVIRTANLKPGGFIYDACGALPGGGPDVVRFGG